MRASVWWGEGRSQHTLTHSHLLLRGVGDAMPLVLASHLTLQQQFLPLMCTDIEYA